MESVDKAGSPQTKRLWGKHFFPLKFLKISRAVLL